MMNGKKGEERLVTQVQLLHRELRMAWLHQERLQNAPTVSAVDLDDRLRSEMAKIARQESEVLPQPPREKILSNLEPFAWRPRNGQQTL